jgi:pyruvate carboxylase subunit B
MFPEIGRDFLEQRSRNTLVAEPLEQIYNRRANEQSRPTEFNVSLHGETYHIRVTGTGHRTQDNRPFYMTVDGVPEEVLVEILDEIQAESAPASGSGKNPVKGSKRPRATLPGHVTTSMPGTIVDILVNVGNAVTAGTPVLITEAMKMETELQAPVAGTIKAIHVKKGESVNPDETLVEIE